MFLVGGVFDSDIERCTSVVSNFKDVKEKHLVVVYKTEIYLISFDLPVP